MNSKHVLITGGGSGIGLATTERLLEKGYKVSVWDREIKNLKNKLGTQEGLTVTLIDLLDRVSVKNAAEKAISGDGVDILINNAGVLVPGDFHTQKEKDWEFILNVNLNSAIYLTSLILPSMYERNSGQIINISSAAGLLGVPGLAVYCASKYGIYGFTEALRHEAQNLGKTGVHFTTVHPNFLRRGLFEGAALNKLGNLIVPRVKNHDVIAKAVVEKAVLKKKIIIYRPATVHLTQLLRGILPYRLFLILGRLLGVHTGMSRHRSAEESQNEEDSRV